MNWSEYKNLKGGFPMTFHSDVTLPLWLLCMLTFFAGYGLMQLYQAVRELWS